MMQYGALSEGDICVRRTIDENPVAKGLAIVVASQESRAFPNAILEGVTIDFQNTCSAFRLLRYAVLPLLNATEKMITDVVQAVPKCFPICGDNDPRYKRIVFYFAGHGDNNVQVHTHDGEINVDRKIIWPLLPENCPNLRHIPKLFFIDACRGEGTDIAIPRGGGNIFSRVSGMANYLVVRSTLPTMKAFEQSNRRGGFWTQAFVEQLISPTNKGRDIGYILIEINRQVNRLFNSQNVLCTQQAITESTLLDHVFFLDEAQELEELASTAYTWSSCQPGLPGLFGSTASELPTSFSLPARVIPSAAAVASGTSEIVNPLVLVSDPVSQSDAIEDVMSQLQEGPDQELEISPFENYPRSTTIPGHYKQKVNRFFQENGINPTYEYLYGSETGPTQYRCTVRYTICGESKEVDSVHYYLSKGDAKEQVAKLVLERENVAPIVSKGISPPSNKIWKSKLKEYCDKNKVVLPSYCTVPTENGFKSTFTLFGQDIKGKECKSKQEAEQNVAHQAWLSLEHNNEYT
ncbi:uncharacterized protein LOC135344597 isoform X3 [Halichondria panicea]|uniref:uncharacterized protein LOC135344597 isoform X3 n=1 Tax=Halichondria panicea TaxID=6063 RepID=UPI00312B6BBB